MVVPVHVGHRNIIYHFRHLDGVGSRPFISDECSGI